MYVCVCACVCVRINVFFMPLICVSIYALQVCFSFIVKRFESSLKALY